MNPFLGAGQGPFLGNLGLGGGLGEYWNNPAFFPTFMPQPPVAQNQERLQRQDRINSFLPAIQAGIIQNLPAEQVKQVLQDLKEEGNSSFREKQYIIAGEHYTLAVKLSKMMEINMINVDHDLISTLFSNMAACCLKLDSYKDAVENTNFALSLNNNNIKAYYRKATALKITKDYVRALEAAEEGEKRACSRGKTVEVREFQELILEIRSHLVPLSTPQPPTFAGAAAVPPKPQVRTRTQPSSVTKTNNTVIPSKKYAGVSCSTRVSPRQQRVVVSPNSVNKSVATADVDEDWLDGTNVNVTRKAEKDRRRATPKNKHVASVHVPVKANDKSQKKFSQLDSNSEEAASDETDEDTAEYEDVLRFAEDLSALKKGETPFVNQSKWNTPVHTASSMGLDDFSVPGTSFNDISVVPKQKTVRQPSPMRDQASKVSSQYSSSGMLQHATGISDSEHKATIQKTTNFVPPQPLPPPFDYLEYKMVCQECFQKMGEGCSGTRYLNTLPHSCSKDVMIARMSDNSGLWQKVRPRPKPLYKTNFTGRYRLCTQYMNNIPCKVPEQLCTFAHNDIEIDLWMADQMGEFNIVEFINNERSLQGLASITTSESGHVFSGNKPTNIPAATPAARRPSYTHFLPGGKGPVSTYSDDTSSTQSLPDSDNKDKIMFPLARTHDFKLACLTCFKPTEQLGQYVLKPLDTGHNCAEDIFAVKSKQTGVWVKVRERNKYRDFRGKYVMCRNYSAVPPRPCMVNENSCNFAHNFEEQKLWTMEKDGLFNIQEFMLQHKTNRRGFTVVDLYRKHQGMLHYICRSCFYLESRISFQSSFEEQFCPGRQHPWAQSKMLIHFDAVGCVTPIQKRPFTHKTAYFLMCHRIQFCQRRTTTCCTFAHSMIERDVWMVERDLNISQEDIVLQYIKQWQVAQDKFAAASPKHIAQTPRSEGFPSAKQALRCPFRIIQVCSMCWKTGIRSIQDGNKDRCSGKKRDHIWSINKMFLITPQNKELRPLPKRVTTNFSICRHIQAKKTCDYAHGYCQFAHSHEEIEVWKWMVQNKVTSLEQLLEISQKSQDVAVQPKKICDGQSVVAVWASPPVSRPNPKAFITPLDLIQNSHYCHYCSIHCNSETQWVEHCASDKHMFNVNSDKEHQWNYRQPPWGVPRGNYELCTRHMVGKCRYSGMPDNYNQCKFAHSQNELDEWKERWEWRQMKREIAKKEGIYSFMDALLDEYEGAESGMTVMSEASTTVEIKCSSDLKLYKQEKNITHVFDFQIRHRKGRMLEKVALLYNKDRLHFSLIGEDLDKSCQIAHANCFRAPEFGAVPVYRVKVLFKGGIFGSFMQWVLFDFGTRPILVRKINVELGTQDVQEKVQRLREKLTFDRWNGDNREIVPRVFEAPASPSEAFNKKLLKKYKAPTSADAIVNFQSLGVELNRHNYVHKMQKMLQLEELTRQHIISGFNLKARVDLTNTISEQTMVFARKGELFAKVPLTEQLTEDTDAGKLILTGLSHVLVAKQCTNSRKVYECDLVTKENFDFDGKGRNHIYICLSPQFCSDMGLSSGSSIDIEMQFQLDRLHFCRMHYAVEQLDSTDQVFPDVSKIHPQWYEKHTVKVSSNVLNEDQMKIVRHIVANRTGYNPPLIVYGPFGTGKTETLAQGTMVLIKEKPNSKVLICTQSNSAADLYIIKHFDAFVERSQDTVRLMRIYYQDRRVNTVQPQVKKYCLLSKDHSHFLMPTHADVMKQNVVITTLTTSLMLSRLNLRGHFTHIFLDEAAQALETETIMPLSLITGNTCVVMAGDHMQMSPKVYCKEARNQKFQKSLLERVYHHYNHYQSHLDEKSHLNILLSINYRTKMELLRFISAIFYGGPQKLIPASNLPNVAEISPLTFYIAQGSESQDLGSTSFYNMAEVKEITDRVEELWLNWPSEWGERRTATIGVVTPYLDQVHKLRASFRARRRELREVTVERVMNVQGKEFQALFISTVRTWHLAENRPSLPKNTEECDGDFGDFGFLSDLKLLNTAFTRAQSLVAVVGDPIALCCIGECQRLWQTFLKHCENMESIHPKSITLSSIKSQVMNLMNSSFGQNIEYLAALHRDAKLGKTPPEVEEREDAGKDGEESDAASVASKATESSVIPNGIDMSGHSSEREDDGNPLDATTQEGLFENWNLDYQVDTDDIIQQLARESIKTSNRVRKTVQEAKARSSSCLKEAKSGHLKVECIKVKEEEGHAVITYSPKSVSERKRHLRTGNDCDLEFDSESDLSESEDRGERTVYTDYSVKELTAFLKAQPDRYKHCVLKLESSQNMYARIINGTGSNIKDIKISSRLRCGRGFNNDEVVVELLPSTDNEDDARAMNEREKVIPRGQVIGVLKRSINPKYRMFVCMVEQGNTGLMIPLNRGIPKIYNLEPLHRFQKAKKGHVCVYSFTKDMEIIFHHYEQIDPANPCSKLFIVRYLKWEAKFYSPLGIVVGVLPAGNSIENGMKILEIEHHIPKRFKETAEKEVQSLYHNDYNLPDSALLHRIDFRDKITFTIDPPGSEDLDDALSIETLQNSQFCIGVHIADVSYFVKKSSCIDSEAQNRGVTHYPVGGDPIPMIPNRLATDLCSLKPKQDRLTLSLFITVNHAGDLERFQLRRCVINSKYCLEYSDAEAIINGESQDYDDALQLNIFMLHRIAEMWRKKRLGNTGLYHQLNAEGINTPKAHMLVEEIMIEANHQVASYLLKKYPQCTPLRNQLPPNEVQINEWRRKHAHAAGMSPALTKPFLPPGHLCKCEGVCTCVKGTDTNTFVDLDYNIWKQIQEASEEGNHSAIQSIVLDPLLHPQLSVAMLQLRCIQERSAYVCSGDIPEEQYFHYSLNLFPYTHFSSPIRRYIDLVVHRLLVATLDDQPCPYTKAEMKGITAHCTDVTVKANSFENSTHSLHLSALLQNRPVSLYPVIESIDSQSIQLRFPTIGDITASKSRLDFSLLHPSEKPVLDEDLETIVLTWTKRIYDLAEDRSGVFYQNGVVELSHNKYMVRIYADIWREMLGAIQLGRKDDLILLVQAAARSLPARCLQPNIPEDVSSEVKCGIIREHFTTFKVNLHPCAISKVQVAADLTKGLLSPKLQLFNITPRLDICLEHRSAPLQCFTAITNLQASKKNYPDIRAYVNAWMPVLAMETAHNAINNDESAIIHNVLIKWVCETKENGPEYTATFKLPMTFCLLRQLRFSGIQDADVPWAEEDGRIPDGLERVFDFMCVRYTDFMSEITQKPDNLRVDVDLAAPICWVAHCHTTKVLLDRHQSQLTLYLKLFNSSMPFPSRLLDENMHKLATVEWLPKALPDRRVEKAMFELDEASRLAQDIAVGRAPVALENDRTARIASVRDKEIPHLTPCNASQDRAINFALSNPFTLIWGPPGTGKTVTGVRLAYLFVQLNRMMPPNKGKNHISPQVLYCGPSNKSVDVVAVYLKRLLGHCPKLVRVYSERIERQEFPIPNDPAQPIGKKSLEIPTEIKDIALHHLIRMEGKSHARWILEYDDLFRNKGDEITTEEVQSYLRLVTQAEIEELKNAEIILCTCTASSAPKILFGTNISQLIVDECGMCKEPESMVPIITSGASQVVLIGDHKQLRPIVLEDMARALGLEKSLFERYCEKAHMLNVQYRMHDAIAAFPAEQFYNHELSSGKDEQRVPSNLKFWPNGRNQPIAFVHIVGQEQSLAVSTTEGSEQSKSNMEEVTQAVRVARLLVRRYHVDPQNVVVMSQYRAQCSEIQKHLQEKGETDIEVSTVIASQGSEWDFVIMSTVRSIAKFEIEKKPTNGWRKRKLGFIVDEHQINVAITRARKGLIIIGNKYLLACDPTWQKLLNHYNNHKKVVDAHEFMTIK